MSRVALLFVLLRPWEPSPTVAASFFIAALLFMRGSRVKRVSVPRRIAFWSGFVLLYLSLHTRLDYYAEHEFFVHRTQHLILHHLGPLLVMAAYPGMELRAGLPGSWRARLHTLRRHGVWRAVMAVVLHPALVTTLFILSVLVWLVPSVQFVSMLDWRLYRFMNWSVTITGLMYWGLLLDHRPSPPGRMRPGMRVLSPVLTMTPQIVAGAIVTFTQHDLYPIFTLCGRAYSLSPLMDQSLGGLIMWVPAAMLEAIGAMLALRQLLRLSEGNRRRRARGPAVSLKRPPGIGVASSAQGSMRRGALRSSRMPSPMDAMK